MAGSVLAIRRLSVGNLSFRFLLKVTTPVSLQDRVRCQADVCPDLRRNPG